MKNNHLWVEGLYVCSFLLCFYSFFMRIYFIWVLCHFKTKMCMRCDLTVAFGGLCFREIRAPGPNNLLADCWLQHYLCWQNTWEPCACLSGDKWLSNLWSVHTNVKQLITKLESVCVSIWRDVHGILWATPAADSREKQGLIKNKTRTSTE